MDYDKKDITVIILSLGLGISLILNINFGIQTSGIYLPSPEKQTLIVGIRAGPPDLDPTDAWDYYSYAVIEQVAETLFTHNMSDPEHRIVNVLAESYTWINLTTLEITVKKNIIFHDGEPFNAEAAAWNVDRLIYLMNHTKQLQPYTFGHAIPAKAHSLYEFPNDSPIINHTIVITTYKFQIFLNAPYAPIISSLANPVCSILSPASTPFNRFLDKSDPNDLLVGTGPFVYEYYIADTEVRFHRWEEYWQTPAFFDDLIFDVIDDPYLRNHKLVGGDIDYLYDPDPDFFNIFGEYPWIEFKESIGARYYYLKMNNDDRPISVDDDPVSGLNVTWRKAISYALNYTHIINELTEGRAIRSNSPISPAIFGNCPSVRTPTYNITRAREIMVSMGFGNIAWNDIQWKNAEFITLNYSFGIGHTHPWWGVEDLYYLLKEDLGLIGITIQKDGWNGACFIGVCPGPPSWFGSELAWTYITPKFFDPLYILLTIFSNSSQNNFAQVNDPYLQHYLEKAIQELNVTKRAKIYSEIQYYLTEELFPHIFGFHPKIYLAYTADLENVLYNGFNKLCVYPIKRNLTWSPFT